MSKNWISKMHLKKGALRKTAGVSGDKKIPASWLKSHASGSGLTARRARMALAFRKMKH